MNVAVQRCTSGAGIVTAAIVASIATGQSCDLPRYFDVESRTAFGSPLGVATGDLDGDGDLDTAVVGGGDVRIGLNDGTGTISFQPPIDDERASIAIGDGDADLATADRNGDTASILLNAGDGTFAGPLSIATGDSPFCITMSDINADGSLDIVVGNYGSGDLSLLLNQGDATFQPDDRYGVGLGPQSIAAGDLDGDGDPDLSTANIVSDDTSVLINRCIAPPCDIDLDDDRNLDADDFFLYLDAFAAGDLDICDIDEDGDCDNEDFFDFVDLFSIGC